MTRDKAIAELVRIWHSPHLDLSLKAGLGEAIETLKEKNRSDSLVRDDAENCKESESKLDLISRQDAIEAIEEIAWYHQNRNREMVSGANSTEDQAWYKSQDIYAALEALPSAKALTSQSLAEPNKELKGSDLISRQAAIECCQCLHPEDCWAEINALPSAEPKTDEENELKFYYVESIDDYWIGRRLDNFYYADWHDCLGFVWSKSRYLPWGEHIVDENTLWKEHTYPSEPIEIPFTEWIKGFVKKYFAEPKTGEWVWSDEDASWMCGACCCVFREIDWKPNYNFCPNCGARMKGADDE